MQYLNKQGIRKFVGNVVGNDQKVYICGTCQRKDSRKAPFVAACKALYTSTHQQLLQVCRQFGKLCTM